ncbi:MAG: hypothetical protein ABI895_10485 [Deltaproteobacteria bacterium]
MRHLGFREALVRAALKQVEREPALEHFSLMGCCARHWQGSTLGVDGADRG